MLETLIAFALIPITTMALFDQEDSIISFSSIYTKSIDGYSAALIYRRVEMPGGSMMKPSPPRLDVGVGVKSHSCFQYSNWENPII